MEMPKTLEECREMQAELAKLGARFVAEEQMKRLMELRNTLVDVLAMPGAKQAMTDGGHASNLLEKLVATLHNSGMSGVQAPAITLAELKAAIKEFNRVANTGIWLAEGEHDGKDEGPGYPGPGDAGLAQWSDAGLEGAEPGFDQAR